MSGESDWIPFEFETDRDIVTVRLTLTAKGRSQGKSTLIGISVCDEDQKIKTFKVQANDMKKHRTECWSWELKNNSAQYKTIANYSGSEIDKGVIEIKYYKEEAVNVFRPPYFSPPLIDLDCFRNIRTLAARYSSKV